MYGTPSSNRAELFAVLRALRTCKEVKTLHIQCDSETTHKMILKSLEGKILKHHTPNRDLIERCAQEINWRTENSKESSPLSDAVTGTSSPPSASPVVVVTVTVVPSGCVMVVVVDIARL